MHRREVPEDIDEYVFNNLWQNNRNLAIYGSFIIDTSVDDHVFALDAGTGRLAWETEILDYRENPAMQSSGPIVADGKVISGRSCMPAAGPDGCVITAHDAQTGAELWRRRTIPAPGETGDETWGGVPFEERKHVGAWMVPSYDPELNLVYIGTSVTSPAPKFLIGGTDNRHLYHNSTLALDADTGEIVWYFQHLNDHWDLDHPSAKMAPTRRCSMRYVIAILSGIVLLPVPAAAQGPERTPWGDPDLQGVWTNRTTTPLERPSEFEGRAVLSHEERAEIDAQAEAARDRPPPPGQTGGYNSFWLDRGVRNNQTSLIVDPPDGRYPARTERVRESDAAFAALRDGTRFETWQDLNLYDRCLTRGMPGAMIPGFYNHNYQILQTPDYVVVLVEMIHDARIIPLDGRAHLSPQIGQWMGDSRARWEGDTLVVETTNLTPRGDQRVRYLVHAGSEQASVVERFTRVDADRIDYSFKVTDPATYESPWTAEIPMVPLGGEIFEYACHEGNYGLVNILAGARAAEQ